MKKTISVNIKGLNFLIEEDAYEMLQSYLERLKNTLRNEDGSQEIIEDVELRIAELCSSKLSDSKTVIELIDIESILSALGNPEDYVDEESEDSFEQEKTYAQSKGDKRLYRDTDNAVIAGICSGIANFFHIDVVIIRALFVIMFFFAGFGFPLYVIMWIIVPKAKSTIDRLRMKGRPITVETVKEEVENAAQNLSKGSKKFANAIRHDDHYQQGISRGVRIISSIFGIGFIAFGLILLVPFLIFIIGGFEFIPVQGEHGFISFTDFGNLVLNNGGDFTTMWIGGLMVGFSVILFLLLMGSMFLFRLKNKWTRLSLFGLFLTGLTGFILCATIGISSGKDFANGGEIERNVGDIYTPQLNVFALPVQIETKDGYSVTNDDHFQWLEISDKKITQYGVHFEYVRSSDSLFHVRQSLSARGISKTKGIERARNIQHEIQLVNDSLHVSPEYSFPKSDKLRNQEITIIIEIPEGGTVKFKDQIITLGEYDPKEDEDYSDEEEGYLRPSGKYDHYED